MFDYLVAASYLIVDDASDYLYMVVVVVVVLVVVVVAAVVVLLEQLTNDVYNVSIHRTDLTRIVLNNWHSHEMDIPYRDTCWILVDLMLRKIERFYIDANRCKCDKCADFIE